jgi:hypothetical protein
MGREEGEVLLLWCLREGERGKRRRRPADVVHEGEKGRERYGCGLLHGCMQLK